jgi:hypothetical protein
LVVANKNIELQVTAGKTKYMAMPEIRIRDEVKIQKLITVPSRGWISSNIWEQEIKSRMKLGNASYLSFGAEYFVFQFAI